MDMLTYIKEIAPEISDIIGRRYLILRYLLDKQPIGRRTLSLGLGIKERKIRDEVSILKDQGFLSIDFMGMYITDKGKNSLEDLQNIYSNLKDIDKLEKKLEKLLGIKKVLIIPGDSREDSMVLQDMGRAVSRLLKEIIEEKDIIGIGGGNTMAAISNELVQDNKKRDIMVVPASGGLGKDVEIQSNSIAAKVADKLAASYRLLYLPDGLEEEALKAMLKNEEIKESLRLIEHINTLVFGIGKADTMAKRRKLSPEKIEELIKKGAVAEAFGHYFDIDGKEIWQYKTIGLSLDSFKTLDKLIALAGGEEKAEAIVSISKLNSNINLITDESAAKTILKMV